MSMDNRDKDDDPSNDQRNHANHIKQSHAQLEQKQAVGLTGIILPGLDDEVGITGDTVEKHKFAAASQKQKPQCNDQNDDCKGQCQRENPVHIGFKKMPDFVFRGNLRSASAITAASAVSSSAFPQKRQPGTESQRKPLADIKRRKQNLSGLFDGLVDRIDNTDGLSCYLVHTTAPLALPMNNVLWSAVRTAAAFIVPLLFHLSIRISPGRLCRPETAWSG